MRPQAKPERIKRGVAESTFESDGYSIPQAELGEEKRQGVDDCLKSVLYTL